MPDIIGEPISGFVREQIKARQRKHGKKNNRTPEDLVYLNSKTAWVKMASGIKINKTRAKKELLREGLSWDSLARYAVLFGGVSRLNDGVLEQRGSLSKYGDYSNIWNYYDGSYNINATLPSGQVGEFGLVPMPSIESVDVKCLNRGSIEEVNVKLKCYSPEQFKIIDLLYLRIGYTMFIEWGWAPYINNKGENQYDYPTLIEDENGFFKQNDYRDFLGSIQSLRSKYRGNYDGVLCKVTNFTWTFNQNGSYDIDLKLISMGDVIESLKTNITPNKDTSDFIISKYKDFTDESSDADLKDTKNNNPSPVDNWISAYFFVNKLLLLENQDDLEYWKRHDINLKFNNNDISVPSVFINPYDSKLETLFTTVNREIFPRDNDGSIATQNRDEYINDLISDGYTLTDIGNTTPTEEVKWYYTSYNSDFNWDVVVTVVSIDAQSIIKDQKKSDIIYLHYNTLIDDEDLINDQGMYIRFGHLLDIIKRYIIPLQKSPSIEAKDSPPIIDINSETYTNKMYLFPYMVSLDPRVCVISSNPEDVGDSQYSKKFYSNLKQFKAVKNNEVQGYGYTMNVYLNCNKINEIISNNLDEKNNLDLFAFLESVCTELNKAFGGINNLEPIVDKLTNTIRIVDGSYSNPKKPDYTLELYGYNDNQSNFIRDFSIKTEITNDFATMATVGSTAGGYTKGVENTMFSKWNKGLEDIVPSDKKVREAKTNQTPEPPTLYKRDFWNPKYKPFGLTPPQDVEYDSISTPDICALSDDIIDYNISNVSEFYKYCQSQIQEKEPSYSSPTNGFIPISLSFTMEGISGLKIYNEINVDTRFLPQNYPDNLRFIIKGVNHSISKNDWTTKIETVVISNTSDGNGKPILSYQEIKDIVKKIIDGAVYSGGTSDNSDSSSGTGGSGGTGGSNESPSSNTAPTTPGLYGYPVTAKTLEINQKAGGIPYVLLPGGINANNTTDTMEVRKDKVGTNPDGWPNTLRPGNSGYDVTSRHWPTPNPDYKRDLIVPIEFPTKNGNKKIFLHKDFAAKMEIVAKELRTNHKHLIKYIKSLEGGWSTVRSVTNGDSLSYHSYGLAVDINSNIAGFRWGDSFDFKKKKYYDSEKGKWLQMQSIHYGIWRLARIMSFQGIWWYYKKDAMHFALYEGKAQDPGPVPSGEGM